MSNVVDVYVQRLRRKLDDGRRRRRSSARAAARATSWWPMRHGRDRAAAARAPDAGLHAARCWSCSRCSARSCSGSRDASVCGASIASSMALTATLANVLRDELTEKPRPAAGRRGGAQPGHRAGRRDRDPRRARHCRSPRDGTDSSCLPDARVTDARRLTTVETPSRRVARARDARDALRRCR